jgi:hypothetical protein
LVVFCFSVLIPCVPAVLAQAPKARHVDEGSKTDAVSGPLSPTVEVEEDVYHFTSANNGAGPLWCHGSTCLVRVGDKVFASGIETLEGVPPLNNCRWMLFERGADSWERKYVDTKGRTREPAPVACFTDGSVFVSANPTLTTNSQPHAGPARPELFRFSATDPAAPPEQIVPVWAGTPAFTEHSYRSLAADGTDRTLILFQNVDYTHAEWAFRDASGKWPAQGKLIWPWGADYEKPQPIRVCYPTVALKGRAVYFCGVSDIIEPNSAWRNYKKQLTGREWDYDFRRLFYTWSPDVATGKFQPWIEIASREQTCGWITPNDLWVAHDGRVHLLWTERALDERLHKKFFPDVHQSYALRYAVVREGKVEQRRDLVQSDGRGAIPSAGRLQVTPEGRLFVIYYDQGKDAAGRSLSENRVLEIKPDGTTSQPVRVPMKQPFVGYFTATVRGGSPPSKTVDLLGQCAGKPNTICYARVKLW